MTPAEARQALLDSLSVSVARASVAPWTHHRDGH